MTSLPPEAGTLELLDTIGLEDDIMLGGCEVFRKAYVLKGSFKMLELEYKMIADLIEGEETYTGMDMVRDFRKIDYCVR